MLIKRADYTFNLKLNLKDTSKSEKIEIDSSKVLNYLIKMENIIIGDLQIYNTFQPVGSKPGILYRLAKIHKLATDNIPSFHPILSAIGTHSNKLAKFFVPLVE